MFAVVTAPGGARTAMRIFARQSGPARPAAPCARGVCTLDLAWVQCAVPHAGSPPASARAKNRRFRCLSALRVHTKNPCKMDFHRQTLRALNRLGGPGPGRGLVGLGVRGLRGLGVRKALGCI